MLEQIQELTELKKQTFVVAVVVAVVVVDVVVAVSISAMEYY